MLKEQVAEILDSIEKVAGTGVMLPKNHYRDQILNLFKSVVDRLTVIDQPIIDAPEYKFGFSEGKETQLQDTKKQLLDLIEE